MVPVGAMIATSALIGARGDQMGHTHNDTVLPNVHSVPDRRTRDYRTRANRNEVANFERVIREYTVGWSG